MALDKMNASHESRRTPGRTQKQTGRAIYFAIMGMLAWIWLAPLLWMIVMSFKPNNVLQRSTAGLLPLPFTMKNFSDILLGSQTPRWFLNSVIVSVTTTVLTLILCSLAGYAFARIPFRGKSILFPLVLAGLMVPWQAIFVPLYLMFANWKMHNTYSALILPRLAAPLGVFIMTQFFKAIPSDIEEAAYLDGATRLRIYWRIMLPLAVPALTALGIFTFLNSWNDFLWPLVSATKTDMYTITVGLASRQGNFAQSEGLGFLMAMAVVASAPVVLVFLFFQRYIVQGLTMGRQF